MTMPAESEQLDERWGTNDRGSFRADNLVKADWAGRRLMRAHEHRAEVAAEFDAVIAEWTEAKAAALRKIEHDDIDYFTNQLNLYLVREVESDEDGDPTEAKTINLPCGVTLAYRPNPSGTKRMVVSDDAAALEWAKEFLPEAITEKLVNAMLKEAALTGIDIPGVQLLDPQHEPFQVSLPKRLRQ